MGLERFFHEQPQKGTSYIGFMTKLMFISSTFSSVLELHLKIYILCENI